MNSTIAASSLQHRNQILHRLSGSGLVDNAKTRTRAAFLETCEYNSFQAKAAQVTMAKQTNRTAQGRHATKPEAAKQHWQRSGSQTAAPAMAT